MPRNDNEYAVLDSDHIGVTAYEVPRLKDALAKIQQFRQELRAAGMVWSETFSGGNPELVIDDPEHPDEPRCIYIARIPQ